MAHNHREGWKLVLVVVWLAPVRREYSQAVLSLFIKWLWIWDWSVVMGIIETWKDLSAAAPQTNGIPKIKMTHPSPWHSPRRVTQSPSFKKERVTLSPKSIGFYPDQESSIMDPKAEGSSPLIVPLPNKSPTFILQPVTAWWVSYYSTLQYKLLKFVFVTVWVLPGCSASYKSTNKLIS